MILSFKTHIDGKPTYFVEKIHKCFADVLQENVKPEIYYPWEYNSAQRFGSKPKLHTIREDKAERWKPGMMIDFFIATRTKNMFRFAPHIQVVSTQEIFMTRRGTDIEITISKPHSYIGGDDFYVYHDKKEILARNDGFDTYSDFVDYFYKLIEENGNKTGNYWFKGKIIHWTDFKY